MNPGSSEMELRPLHELHLLEQIRSDLQNYLFSEMNSDRLKMKNDLRSLVREYLAVVSPLRRFIFKNSFEVFRDTIYQDKVNTCKVASAWEAMVDYAANILTQPWRKEFIEVRMYSGFYKHHIEEYIVGGERMFELLGYQPGTEATLVLNGTPDYGKTVAVALDSFLAFVEIQMMDQVMTDLIKILPQHNINLQSIYMFRIYNTGSVAEIIEKIFRSVYPEPSYWSYQLWTAYRNSAVNPYTNYQTSTDPTTSTGSQSAWNFSPAKRIKEVADLHQLDGDQFIKQEERVWKRAKSGEDNHYYLSGPSNRGESAQMFKDMGASFSRLTLESNPGIWSCLYCTFDNEKDSNMCEMCLTRRLAEPKEPSFTD